MRKPRPVVTATCAECASEQSLQKRNLDRQLRLYGKYRCPACAFATAENRAKCSASGRGAWADPAYRAAQENKEVSVDTRLKLSASTSRIWEDPEGRAKLVAGIRGAIQQESTQNRRAVALASRGSTSSLSLAVSRILTDFGVEHRLEEVFDRWTFDVFVPHLKLAIEVQGEFFHRMPLHANRDRLKAHYLAKHHPDVRLVYVLESDLVVGERVSAMLRGWGVDLQPSPITNFGALSIGPVVRKEEALPFLTAFHYLGSLRGALRYGLWHGELLVGVAAFGAFQRNEQRLKYGPDAVELTRFCLHPAFNAKGLGSWFLSRCLKDVGRTVVTYADTTWGHTGTLYRACNFTFSHRVRADYSWRDPDGRMIHKKTIWERAQAARETEVEWASKHGFARVDGLEKLCFVYAARPKRIRAKLRD